MKTQRLALRTPYFIIRPEYLITLGLMALLILAFTASLADAQTTSPSSTTTTTTKRVRKSTTTITQVDEDGEIDAPVSSTTTSSEIQEGEILTTFGSKATSGTAGCKTEELNKGVIRDLKSDCKAWIKDQRADLKGKFNTSSCEESCMDCGMSLQRCTVTGTVRYRK